MIFVLEVIENTKLIFISLYSGTEVKKVEAINNNNQFKFYTFQRGGPCQVLMKTGRWCLNSITASERKLIASNNWDSVYTCGRLEVPTMMSTT